MKTYYAKFEVPDEYEPMFSNCSATGFFFDTKTGEQRAVDSELKEGNDSDK